MSDIATLTRRCEDLAKEVARLRAREEIRARVFGFCRALDRLDAALLLAQFHPEAEVDYGVFYKGPVAGFVPVAMGFQGSMRETQHLVGNVCIELEGERASAESYVHAHHVIVQGEERVQLMVGARYLDRFELRGGAWKIAYRTEVIDWGRWLPIAERWFEDNREMPKGQRSPADLSYRFLASSASSE